MDQHVARHMFEEGGTLIMLGMPVGTEFGIDLNSWSVGERFKGVKMIPPGVHFVYYSAVNREGDVAPRTGFFHTFQQREVVVRHYDPRTEDLTTEEDVEQLQRIEQNLQGLDSSLGAYPLESWKKWVSLTQHINQQELDRLVPLSGKIKSVPELVPTKVFVSQGRKRQEKGEQSAAVEGETAATTCQSSPSTTTQADDTTDTPLDNQRAGLPDMVPAAGTEFRFTSFPARPYREGASPAEVTRYSLDSSYSINQVIQELKSVESLLAELQLSFVCFLVGQVWEGWEQWRLLLTTLCRAEQFLQQSPQLYNKFLSIIHFQIQEVPEDFFVDIVESNNFLAATLATLFANISDNACTLPPQLVKKARQFKSHLISKFKWDLSLEDIGEDAPVVVETETEEQAPGQT